MYRGRPHWGSVINALGGVPTTIEPANAGLIACQVVRLLCVARVFAGNLENSRNNTSSTQVPPRQLMNVF